MAKFGDLLQKLRGGADAVEEKSAPPAVHVEAESPAPMAVDQPLGDDSINLLMEPELEDLYPEAFEMTNAHLALIRQVRLAWSSRSNGAVMVDPKRPYFGGPTSRQLTLAFGDRLPDQDQAKFLLSMVAAMEFYCRRARIVAATYPLQNIDHIDVENAAGGAERTNWYGLNEDGTVILTDELLALVRNLQWDWPDEDDIAETILAGELPAPVVDAVRPYGSMSEFQLDIHRILGWPAEAQKEDGEPILSEAQKLRAAELHFRSMLAAQALFEHGVLELEDGQ